MRAAPWIGSAALIGAVAVTLIGARTQASVLVSGWQTEAEAALRALGAEDVTVRVDGRTLHVAGSVADATHRDGVLAALATIQGFTAIENRLTLTAGSSRPEGAEELAPSGAAPDDPPAYRESDAATSGFAALCQGELDALFEGEVIRFAAYSAAVSPDNRPLLEDAAEIMAKCPEAVLEIAGHSDGSGIEELNDSLSRARAEAVRQVLMQLGIEGTRLIAVSYGDRQPVADDTTEAGRMQNRRIELRLRETR